MNEKNLKISMPLAGGTEENKIIVRITLILFVKCMWNNMKKKIIAFSVADCDLIFPRFE
jgi:hypothetical protein